MQKTYSLCVVLPVIVASLLPASALLPVNVVIVIPIGVLLPVLRVVHFL